MKINRLPDTVKIFFLFLAALYGFIPFETSSAILTYASHGIALSFIMLAALVKSEFKVKINLVGRITLIFISFFVLLGLLRSFDKAAIVFVYTIVFSSITASIICFNEIFKRQFLNSLKWLILFSIAMLLLQKIVLGLSNNVIRIHEMIYPFSQARISVNEQFSDLYRMGGIYIEPGTYSNMMYMFIIVYMVLSKEIRSPLLIFGALSIILSYSVWGMLAGSFLLLVIIVARLHKSSLKSKAFAVLILFSIGGLSNYIISRPEVKYAIEKMNSDEESVIAKEQVYKKYQNSFHSFILIGEGFLPSFETGLTSFQDAGFLLNISVVFGLIFTIIILIIYAITFIKYLNWLAFFASLPIFFSKIFYHDPTFWLLFFILIYHAFSNVKTEKIVYMSKASLKVQ